LAPARRDLKAQVASPIARLDARRLYDPAMKRRNSRDIGSPSKIIKGHHRCGDKSAAKSGLFNQNGQTEVEMAIVLAKNNLMTPTAPEIKLGHYPAARPWHRGP